MGLDGLGGDFLFDLGGVVLGTEVVYAELGSVSGELEGGSAADAQHWAAELVGRYLCERQPLNAHALTTNSSTYTALVNDYPAEEVFERQVIAHVRANDIVFAISTSGNSENILRAVSAAQKIGAQVVGVTGKDGGQLSNHCDICFIAPSNDTPRIQEAHLFFGHNLCEIIERAFVAE